VLPLVLPIGNSVTEPATDGALRRPLWIAD
jgi:hypothetical protein